jgi:hypothetical protein
MQCPHLWLQVSRYCRQTANRLPSVRLSHRQRAQDQCGPTTAVAAAQCATFRAQASVNKLQVQRLDSIAQASAREASVRKLQLQRVDGIARAQRARLQCATFSCYGLTAARELQCASFSCSDLTASRKLQSVSFSCNDPTALRSFSARASAHELQSANFSARASAATATTGQRRARFTARASAAAT